MVEDIIHEDVSCFLDFSLIRLNGVFFGISPAQPQLHRYIVLFFLQRIQGKDNL